MCSSGVFVEFLVSRVDHEFLSFEFNDHSRRVGLCDHDAHGAGHCDAGRLCHERDGDQRHHGGNRERQCHSAHAVYCRQSGFDAFIRES